MKPICALGIIVGLTLAGCGPKPAMEPSTTPTPLVVQSESPLPAAKRPRPTDSDKARLEALLSPRSYNNTRTAGKVINALGYKLLTHQRFETLEQLFSKIESIGSATSAQALYQNLVPTDPMLREDYEDYIEQWIEAYPKSKYPRLLQASMRSRWLMTDSVWYTFEQKQALTLLAARGLMALKSAETIPATTDHPEFWEARLRIAVVTLEPAEIMDGLLEQTVRRAPDRWTAHALRAYREYPRWTNRDMVAYLRIIDELSTQYGAEVYAVCAWDMFLEKRRDEATFRQLGLDPSKIQAGYRALLARKPNSRRLSSQQARLAVACEQKEEARKLLDDLGQDWDCDAWVDSETHRQACEKVGSTALTTNPKRVVIQAGPESKLVETVSNIADVELADEARWLLQEQHYPVLETAAAGLRKPGLGSRLREFYSACVQEGSKAKTESALARCDLWDAAIPDSTTSRVARAAILTAAAWDARGGGYASDVSQDGWLGFRESLDEAAKLLDETELPDTYACGLRIAVAMGRGESPEVIDRAIERSLSLDPGDFYAQQAKFTDLLPRWRGSREALVAEANALMKQRGASALAYSLKDSNYLDPILEELPYELVDRSLRAAETEAKPRDGVASLRAHVEIQQKSAKHLARAGAALKQMEKTGDFWDWEFHRYQAWSKHLLGGAPLGRASAKVVETGQYSDILPKPKKLPPAKSMPIVAGRSLGIRLRFVEDVPTSVTETVRLVRPRLPNEPGEGPVSKERHRVLPAYAIKGGSQDLIEWTIQEGEQAPGPWTLTVSYDGKEAASQTFNMTASDAASEPGVLVDFFGPLEKAKVQPALAYPLQSAARDSLSKSRTLHSSGRVQAKIGNRFGVLVHFTGKPKKAYVEWVLPVVKKGSEPKRQRIEVDTTFTASNSDLQTQYYWNFETPDELVPGRWKFAMTIDGRSAGSVDFDMSL